jgi:hypothetical protein
MALNLRTPQSDGPAPASSFPIARSFAGIVFLALILLFALKHLFGSVHADVGVK